MEQLFIGIYNFFNRRKPVFWVVFVSTLALIGWGASRIELEEDITKFFPDDARVEKLNYIFRNSKFVERVVVMVSMKDSTTQPQPDSLVAKADTLVAHIESELKPFVKKIAAKVDDQKVMEVFQAIQQTLPVYLDEKDYKQLDSITRPEVAREVLQRNYQQLIAPSGIVTKRIIVQDPLGFSFLALKKLQQLQYDENFELYDNYIITRDHRHILFFLQPAYPPAETKHNSEFVAGLQNIVNKTSSVGSPVIASYFGASIVAVGNAQQLRSDTIITVSIMLVLLMVVILGFFRKKRVPLLMMVPVLFGALFSLAWIALLQGTLSILALAVGAIVLGIAINYSLHYLTILKHEHSAKLVIEELAKPLTIGSTTTVLAFLCLRFTNATVLGDIGLFAGLSLVGAALCSLIFLPHLVREDIFVNQPAATRIERITSFSFESNKYIVYGIFILTPVFFYFAGRVQFNSDMSKLNFMTAETQQAQQRLETITKSSLTAVYIVSDGKTLESALRKNEQAIPVLNALKSVALVTKVSSVSSFLISDSLQQQRIARWNAFWTPERKQALHKVVYEEGEKLRFSPRVLQNFDTLITRQFKPALPEETQSLRAAFFDDFIIEKEGIATVITLANVKPENKTAVYQQLAKTPAHGVDRQMMTNLFVEYIHSDFNFIVTFTSLLVFMALFISYGRIELTLITFVPMLITWIWILGIMALVGIEFNIINVMVSTFIFGLGDDYSIFTMDGLQQEYRANKKVLPTIRTSIFLSAITTICGLGVLIFAKHPALKSIAAISIIGIVCVFVMAQTIMPFLFRVLITNRTAKGYTPVTFLSFFRTFFTYGFFVLGAILLTLVGSLLKIIPVGRARIKLFYHSLLRACAWFVIYVEPNVKKRIIGKTDETFSHPSVIIANHASFLDILLTVMLHPKLILLTNQWVWDSPIFGGVVRLADYYPVSEGAEDSVDRLKDRVEEGYSIVVFPEGSRSPDGKMKRFHKGAFYLAETFQIPIRPLLIHGAGDAIPKGSFILNEGQLTLKFLPAIEANDFRFGEKYSQRTKEISRYFKEEYRSLAHEIETPDYFVKRLITNYIYKGPVLEWYMRVKLRLEKNYTPFEQLIPKKANILDLGCGYGFLCYMLQFLSEERTITGVDYDEHKITTANYGYLKTSRLRFFCGDATTFPVEGYDVIIVSDVLHYLSVDKQDALLTKCFKALNPGGMIIIRDGDADLRERHKGTQLTEFFSIRVMKFNKSENALNFISGKKLRQLAADYGMKVDEVDVTKFTSNVIFVIRKTVHTEQVVAIDNLPPGR
ncbi:MAG TPA: 1-acyl-sn-glycerol-3-phosphate acyltransferase [Ohtaekwangia sp.]|uniref:1-acyl-sn-glycerol-3-phosphate acyltransferase n=1 Tax=Ohtaekwangia sp. TaxID=2066019 RepID=UPI002F958982